MFLEYDFLLKAAKGSGPARKEISFSGVSIDSRQPAKNKVFFALKGPRFDGHDFLSQAEAQGAAGFVVSDKGKAQQFLKSAGKSAPSVIYVPDTLKALQNVARLWSKHLGTKVIAITGSNGKTTTRSFAQTLFSGKKPFASPKSYNNFVGLPLSLLRADRKGAFLIQEIGTSRPGEVAFLASLCDPLISAVTMVGPSHLEGLGSLEAVAEEKRDIYLKSPKAVWIFNRDSLWTEKMFQELGQNRGRVLSFSSLKKADVSLRFAKEGISSSIIEGRIGSAQSKAEVLFCGQANLENLMCGCALALAGGIDPQKIWSLIPLCRLPKGRQELFQIKGENISVFFDAYNANPESMRFFLESCAKMSKAEQRLFILGDMRELGEDFEKYHRELAHSQTILESRFVAFVGEYGSLFEDELCRQRGFQGSFARAKSYDSRILSAVRKELRPGDFLALKASRSLALERLIFDLTGQKAL